MYAIYAVGHERSRSTRGSRSLRRVLLYGLFAGTLLVAPPFYAQDQAGDWQTRVRKYSKAEDWESALRIVDNEIVRAPQDMDMRAWRARVLAWAGQLAEAEKEYLEVLKASGKDPDNWMGLANVYLREGRTVEALRALDTAVRLDPTRADLHAARARALRAAGERKPAQLEFQNALNLDPTSARNLNTNCESAKTPTSSISLARTMTNGRASPRNGHSIGRRPSGGVFINAGALTPVSLWEVLHDGSRNGERLP